MTETFEAYKATFKGEGYEAPWFTVAGRDVEEFRNNLEAIDEETMEIIATIGKTFRGMTLVEVREDRRGSRPARRDDYDDDHPRRSSSGGSRWSGGTRGGTGRSSTSRGGYRDDETPEEHPEGLECEACGAVLVRREGENDWGRYSGWVCPNGRRKGDGHTRKWDRR